MNAMFFHGDADDLTQQRFGDQTCFGMSARGCGQWTAVATNKMLSVALFEGGGATEVLEDLEGHFNSLISRFPTDFEQMFVGHPFADLAHRGGQFPRTELS